LAPALLAAAVVLVLTMGCAALAGLDEDFVVGTSGPGGQHAGGTNGTTSTGGSGLTSGTGGSVGTGGGAGAAGGAGSWYSSSWPYRKAVTFDSQRVAGDLTGFPVLVRFAADPDLAAHAQNGNELLFTASDGTTKLSHEVELFASGGRLDAWVLVPSLSPTADTVIYLYYGNPSAPDQQDAPSVWDADFVGVWHLVESTGSRYDSTSRAHHVAVQSGPIGVTADAISGDATADFESSSAQHLSISDAQQDGLDVVGPLTLTAWIQTESQPGGWRNYLAKWAGGGDETNVGNSYYVAEYASGAGHRIKFAMADASSGLTTLLGGTTLSLGRWYYVAAVYDGSQMRVYIDGVPEGATSARSTGAQNSVTAFDIGGKSSSPTFNHDGPMDEVRVSSIARSESWILTAFRNQNDPEGFVSLSAEQTP